MRTTEKFIVRSYQECKDISMWLSFLGYVTSDGKLISPSEEDTYPRTIVVESGPNQCYSYTVSEWDSTDKEDQYVKFCRSFGDAIRKALIEVNTNPKMKKTDSDGIFVINGFKEDVRIGKLGTIKKSILYSKESKGRVFFTFPDKNYVSGYLQNDYLGEYEYIDLFREIIVRLDTSIVLPELNKYVLFLRSLGFKWKGGDEISPQSIWQIMEQYSSDLLYLKLNDKTITHGKERTTKSIKKPLIIDIRKLPDLFPSEEEPVSIRVSNDEELKRLLYYLARYGYLWEDGEHKSLITGNKEQLNNTLTGNYININHKDRIVNYGFTDNNLFGNHIPAKDWIKRKESVEEGKRIYSKTLSYINILELMCCGYKFERYQDLKCHKEIVSGFNERRWEVTVDIEKKLILGYCKKKYPLLSEICKGTGIISSFLSEPIVDQLMMYDLYKRGWWKIGDKPPFTYNEETWKKSLFKDDINWKKVFEDRDYSDIKKLYPSYIHPMYYIDVFGSSFSDFKNCVELFKSQGFNPDHELSDILLKTDNETFFNNCKKRFLIINNDLMLSLVDDISRKHSILVPIPIKTFLEENKSMISRLNYEKKLIFSEPEFERVYCNKDIIQIKNILIRLMELGYIWKQGMLITPNDIPSVIVKESKEGITFILNEVTKEVYYTREKESEFKEADKWLNESQRKIKNYDKYEVKKTTLKELIKKGYKWDGRERYSFIDYPCFYKDNIKYIVNPGCKKIMGYRYEEENKSSRVFIRFNKHKEASENIIDYKIAIEILSEASEFKSCSDVESRDRIIEVKNFSGLMREQLENNFAIILDLEEKTYKLVTLSEDKTEGMSEILIEEIIYLMPLSNCLIGLDRHIILEILREQVRQHKYVDLSIIANSITSTAVFDWEKSGKKQFWREIFIDRNFHHFYDFYPNHPRSYISTKDSEKLNKLIEKGYRISQLRDKNKEPVKYYLVDQKNKILFREPEASPYWEEFEIEEDVKSSTNSDKILDSENYVIFCRNKEDSVMLQNFPRGIVIVKHIDSGDRRVISEILNLFIRKEGFKYIGLNPEEEGIVDNIPYLGESKKDLLMLINKETKTLTIKEEDGIVFNKRGITTLSLSALYRNIKDFIEEEKLDHSENLKILNNDKSINNFKNKKVMKNSMFDGIIEKFKSQYVPEIDNNIMISMDGNLCIKAGDEAVSVSKDSCEIVSYPVEMCYDIPGLLISKPVNMIVPGDIVKFKETYYKVLEVNPNGTIKVISFSTGTISSKRTIKDFVTGSNLVKVIINFMNGVNPGMNMQQGMSPVMMAMMFQEGDSDDMIKNMIMLSMMNPNSGMNAFTGGMMNPIMMAMMMKNSSFSGEGNDMFKMMTFMNMFNNQGGMFQAGFNNPCQVNNPGIVNQPKPERRERTRKPTKTKKEGVETSGEGGAGIEI